MTIDDHELFQPRKRRKVVLSKQKIKYTVSALLSVAIDYIVNYFTLNIGFTMFFSALSSKIVSSLCNYEINKKYVFRTKGEKIPKHSLIRYYILWSVQTLIGSLLAAAIVAIAKDPVKIHQVLMRIPIDLIIFCVNYLVQKKWVFKGS